MDVGFFVDEDERGRRGVFVGPVEVCTRKGVVTIPLEIVSPENDSWEWHEAWAYFVFEDEGAFRVFGMWPSKAEAIIAIPPKLRDHATPVPLGNPNAWGV